MMKFAALFDPYSLRARLRPALLVLFPALVAIAMLYPGVYQSLGAVLGSLVLTCGVLALLAQAARYLGRKKEIALYRAWGGIPTTGWLRHRDARLDATTKRRYHTFLEKRVPDLKLPSAKDEQKNPTAADDSYRSATKWLLEYTRDKKKYPLVFEENVNYGFQRNTLALKPVALFVIALSIGGTLLDAYVKSGISFDALTQGTVIALAVSLLALIVWFTIVSADWVKDAADAYARALLASCDA